MDIIRSRNYCKLIWSNKSGLDGVYLDTLVSLLNNEKTINAIQIQSSNNSKAWKAVLPNEQIFIKFFNVRGIRDRLFFRKSRACRAMEGNRILSEKGFRSPDVIAAGDFGKKFSLGGSFLITEWIEGSLDMYKYIKAFLKPADSGSLLEKKNFMKTVGHLIGKMHKAGIFHGDLRPGNILIRDEGNDLFFYFIDNERTRYFHKGIPSRLREKNLAQINTMVTPQITFTDRMIFFKAYLDENPELKPIAEELARNIFKKTKKKLQRKHPFIWEGYAKN